MVTVLVGCLAAPAARAETFSLTGERLLGPGAGALGGVTPTTYDCNRSGTSTVSFSVSGLASGPYPGTFTETATVRFGAQDGPTGAGTVTSFEASFTIVSGTTTITGTKSLDPDADDKVAVCGPNGGQVFLDAVYHAANGAATDEGRSSVQFNICADPANCGTIGVGNQFGEEYQSEVLPPPPPPPPPPASGPVSKDQCKNGGFRSFTAPAFRNQGDCVSFVAAGGR